MFHIKIVNKRYTCLSIFSFISNSIDFINSYEGISPTDIDLSSRVMDILLKFQPITRYYGRNLNKEFPTENFPSNRPHSTYYILKVPARTDEFFLRYELPNNVLRERSGF